MFSGLENVNWPVLAVVCVIGCAISHAMGLRVRDHRKRFALTLFALVLYILFDGIVGSVH